MSSILSNQADMGNGIILYDCAKRRISSNSIYLLESISLLAIDSIACMVEAAYIIKVLVRAQQCTLLL